MKERNGRATALCLAGAALLTVAANGRGQAIYTPYTMITIAGNTNGGSADGVGAAAGFFFPAAVTRDGAGNLYIADDANGTIRKAAPVGGNWVVTTIAGQAGILGNVDGIGTNADFENPWGIVMDRSGNLFVCDASANTIRELSPTGTNWTVTTIAGEADVADFGDGTNSGAQFNLPTGLAIDGGNNLYVTDVNNHCIRMVSPIGTNWVVTTIAGWPTNYGNADGTNSGAQFLYPASVAADNVGNVYVGEEVNRIVRKLTPMGTNWVVTTIMGAGTNSGSADGLNTNALLAGALGVATDKDGNVYVSDTFNSTLRKLTRVGADWRSTTLAGVPGDAGLSDGTGSAALLAKPAGLVVDANGNVYVTDFGNQTIREGFPAASVPRPLLSAPNVAGGEFDFGISGLPGLAVEVDSSTDLAQWNVVETTELTAGTNYFADPGGVGNGKFYRVKVR